MEFRRWGNRTNALNSGPQLLHFRHNQLSGKFLAAKAKLRSCVIHVASVRSNLPSHELPKCFCPFFVQLVNSQPLKAPATCYVVSGLFEQFVLEPSLGQSLKSLR